MKNQTPQFRPCIVIDDQRGRMIDGTIVGDVVEHKALFHFWTEKHMYFNNNAYAGIYAQPPHTVQVIGIAEYEDGSVHEIFPSCIRFVDEKVKDYDFKTE